MYWSLFDVALMIYNKIWINTSHEIYIYMNPWLSFSFFRLYQKKEVNVGNNYGFLTLIPLPLEIIELDKM